MSGHCRDAIADALALVSAVLRRDGPARRVILAHADLRATCEVLASLTALLLSVQAGDEATRPGCWTICGRC